MAEVVKIQEISKAVIDEEQVEEVQNLASPLDLKVHRQFHQTNFTQDAPLYLVKEVTPMRKSKGSDMEQIENHLFDKLDALLAEEKPDYSLILDEIFKIVSVITRNSEKMDREAIQIRIKALFQKVKDVQNTFNSKRGIVLAAMTAALLFASAALNIGAGVHGLAAGTVTDTAKNLGSLGGGANSLSQIPGTFSKFEDESKQAMRHGHQAEQEELRRKLSQDQEAGQRKKSQQDKAMQNLKDTIEKWDRTFTEFTR